MEVFQEGEQIQGSAQGTPLCSILTQKNAMNEESKKKAFKLG